MTPALRVKFGLFGIAALFTAVFAWSAAHGQFLPRQQPIIRPGFNPGQVNPPGFPNRNPGAFNGGQPNMNPPGFPRPGFNGGQPGMNPAGIIGGQPGMNPAGFNGGGANITIWQCETCKREVGRGGPAPTKCPFCGVVFNQIHMQGPGGGPPITVPAGPRINPPVFSSMPTSTPADSSSTTSSESSGRGKMVALVVGIIVVGVGVLLGGTWLMIYTMKSGSSSSSRRRRRRRNEDDD